MIHCGNGPRGIFSRGRSGNSASRVLGSGFGNRAFSGFPTITSSRGSHSLQLQTSDVGIMPVPRESASPGQLPEEVRNLDELAALLRPAVHPLADGKVEHTQAEGRDDDRSIASRPALAREELELAIAGQAGTELVP